MIHTELIAPIGSLISRHARSYPAKVAFRDASSSITYAALAEESANLASHLRQLGVAPGQCVAIFLPNSVDWVLSLVAIVRAGAVAVPISVDATDAEVSYRLSDAKCVAVIANADRTEQLARVSSDLHTVPVSIVVDASDLGPSYRDMCRNGAEVEHRESDDIDAPAFVIYTSGTTGKAKGVVLTVRSMLWVVAACWAPIAGLCKDDKVLSFLPLFHSYALNFSVLAILAVGASGYLCRRYSNAEAFQLLQSGEFTVFPGVPTMFQYLMRASEEVETVQFPSLRVCISAGAILPALVTEQFEKKFGVPLLDGYGITETSTMVTMNWRTGTRVMGSCGLPIPGVETRLVSPADGKDVDFGQEGELLVRGANVMQGYLNKPEQTADVLRDGWYHTGDLAKVDASGYLTITGRLKELIIRGGQNIAPAEVEEALISHDSIADCAVVGIAHPLLGEVPVAFVVAKGSIVPNAEELLIHCARHLSEYKLPHAFHVVQEIPRTGSGKIMRFRLRDAVSSVESNSSR